VLIDLGMIDTVDEVPAKSLAEAPASPDESSTFAGDPLSRCTADT